MIKVAFIDRDGVINKNPAVHDYVKRADEFKLNEGILEVMDLLKRFGLRVIVITNQRGIARGLFTEQELASIHECMRGELKGREIMSVLYCPHEEGQCQCRKPKPGLLQRATELYEIDLKNSVYIGDSDSEIEMAKKFGLGNTILIPKDKPELALAQLRKIYE